MSQGKKEGKEDEYSAGGAEPGRIKRGGRRCGKNRYLQISIARNTSLLLKGGEFSVWWGGKAYLREGPLDASIQLPHLEVLHFLRKTGRTFSREKKKDPSP